MKPNSIYLKLILYNHKFESTPKNKNMINTIISVFKGIVS